VQETTEKTHEVIRIAVAFGVHYIGYGIKNNEIVCLFDDGEHTIKEFMTTTVAYALAYHD